MLLSLLTTDLRDTVGGLMPPRTDSSVLRKPRGLRQRVGITVVVLAVALAGCAKVNPRPFETFAESLRTLSSGVEAQAEVDYETAREEYEQSVLDGKVQVTELQFTFPSSDPFGFQHEGGEQPLYVKLEQFRRALKNLNDAMVAYANLLATLGGNETVNPDDFDQLARDLNTKTASAAATLNLGVPGEARAFFSTAAAKIFEEIIERKRRKKLRQAIEAQQPRMKLYAERAQEALGVIVEGVKPRYLDEFSDLADKYVDADREADNEADKKAALQKILDWNKQTADTLRTLERLKNSYGKLPTAHADLAKAVDERQTGLPGVLDFYNETVALHELFTSLKEDQ